MRKLVLLALLTSCWTHPVKAPYAPPLCDRADLASCTEAGRRLARGIGVALDLPAARDLLEKSCARGEGAGCEELAAVSSLLGVPDSGVQEILLRGCAAGHGGACVEATELGGNGPLPAPVAGCRDPVWKDCLEHAGNAFDIRACAAGDGFACARGTAPAQRGRANTLLAAACEKGDPFACEAAGRLSLNDGRSPEGGLRDAARAAFERGCDLGDPDACARLAADDLADPGQAFRALERLQAACAQGSAFACETTGAAALNGVGTAPDVNRGLDALERACTLGRFITCYDLANATAERPAEQQRRARTAERKTTPCAIGRSPLCQRVQE